MKKAVSILLSLIMIMSVSVYAADSITVTQSNGNEATYYSTKTIWDIDFDSTYSVPATGGNIKKGNVNLELADSLKDFDNSGSNMTSDNPSTSNGGNAANKISISNDAAVANAQHDYFLKLETNEGGQAAEVQLNQLQICAKGGIVVIQNDFALGKLPTGKNNVRISGLQLNEGDLSSYNVKPINSVMTVEAGGVIKASTTVTDIVIKENEWHTATQIVDFDKHRIDYYIDGQNVGVHPSATMELIWKFTVYHPKTGSDELVTYIDNIKVFKATTDVIALNCENQAATICEGAPIKLSVQNNNEDLAKDVKILASTDGVNYDVYSEENEAVAYYKSYTTYYKAVAYDADGKAIFQTEPQKFVADYTVANGALQYDMDFDEGFSYAGNVKYNNSFIYPRNDTSLSYFTTNTGNGVIGIEAASGIANNPYGNSLFFDETKNETTSYAQINEGRLLTNADIMVAEIDFAYNQLPASGKTNTIFQYSMTTGAASTVIDSSTRVGLSDAGRLYVVDSPSVTLLDKTSANTWYNLVEVVNTVTDKIDYYINGEYIATVDRKSDKAANDYFHKFQVTANAGAKNKFYVDNIKIYSVGAPAQADLEIGSVKYFINGEEVTNIADGNLSAEVILSNNNAENLDLQCIAAVYSAPGELDRVTVVPVSFDADEYSKLVNFNIGNVASTNVVKIFFWTVGSETNALVPNGANGVLANQ
ncbi:MAG: hypothetical protein II998_09210 [Clostridia bacterium]|nr:hypothetical protein [Clostridia bacterium]